MIKRVWDRVRGGLALKRREPRERADAAVAAARVDRRAAKERWLADEAREQRRWSTPPR